MKQLILFSTIFIISSCSNLSSDNKTTLELDEENGFSFQLVQRNTKEIPAENGHVEIGIGDITGGQTWLTVSHDSMSVYEQSIHQGDTLSFKIDDEQYKITCSELLNNLIGDDLATFKIFK